MKALALILPPLAGALIGYVTNALAVRMLFRPLRPVYLGRFRLPFTPGILPRGRARIAGSIAEIVERELLTPAVVAERLNSAGAVRENLARAASRLFTERAPEWYPRAVSGLIAALARPPLRPVLEAEGRRFLSRVLGSLNVFQRLIVQAAGYEERLAEKMPVIIEDFLGILEETLRKDAVREKCFDLVRERLAASSSFRVSEADCAALLASVDIRALVRDRVDSLDMLEVEAISLGVLAGELGWINVFGAALGALIGAAQVGLSFLLR